MSRREQPLLRVRPRRLEHSIQSALIATPPNNPPRHTPKLPNLKIASASRESTIAPRCAPSPERRSSNPNSPHVHPRPRTIHRPLPRLPRRARRTSNVRHPKFTRNIHRRPSKDRAHPSTRNSDNVRPSPGPSFVQGARAQAHRRLELVAPSRWRRAR